MAGLVWVQMDLAGNQDGQYLTSLKSWCRSFAMQLSLNVSYQLYYF